MLSAVPTKLLNSRIPLNKPRSPAVSGVLPGSTETGRVGDVSCPAVIKSLLLMEEEITPFRIAKTSPLRRISVLPPDPRTCKSAKVTPVGRRILSIPGLKSVITSRSVPDDCRINWLAPPPPVKVSNPLSPEIILFPVPPTITSLPAPP